MRRLLALSLMAVLMSPTVTAAETPEALAFGSLIASSGIVTILSEGTSIVEPVTRQALRDEATRELARMSIMDPSPCWAGQYIAYARSLSDVDLAMQLFDQGEITAAAIVMEQIPILLATVDAQALMAC